MDDEWAERAARLNTICDETLKAIRTRDRSLRIGSDAEQQIATIKKNLQILNADIADLEKELSQAEQKRSISSEELRRRETVVIDLIGFRDRLETLSANKNPHRHERNVHFSESVTTNIINHDDTDAEQLTEIQRLGIEQQDRHLDALSAVVGKQKHLALQIGEELEVHSQLLDDLDEGVDRSQSFLNRASNQLGKITASARNDRSTQLMCMLVMVIIAIVLVVILVKSF